MDALTGLTEVDVSIEEIVSAEVQEVLTAEAVMPGTIMDFSSQARPGMDTVKIPKFGNFTVATKAENTAVDAQVNSFTSDDLVMNKHKVIQFLIEDIAELQSKVMVSDTYIRQAGRDLAADMDDVIITALEALPSAAAPDHILDFGNTPTDTISKTDFLNARAALNTAKVPMNDRYCLIDPTREKDILAISEFVRVDESGGSEALRNGRIGRLFGFDVMMSPLADANATLFYHKSTAVFARQLAPRVQQETNLAHLATRWSIDHIFGVKGLDSGKRIVRIKDGGA
jgi:hypothetical protein